MASVEFALALQFSGLTDPAQVVSFLLLPFHPAFDASMGLVALGSVPFISLLYRYARGTEKPLLGGQWKIPKAGKIDAKLLVGAAAFGVGWGLGGVCRECHSSLHAGVLANASSPMKLDRV